MKRTPKRAPEERNPFAHAIRPRFFWCLCHKCKAEFRREPGWAVKSGRGYRYVCGECADSADAAHVIVVGPRPRLEKAVHRFARVLQCRVDARQESATEFARRHDFGRLP